MKLISKYKAFTLLELLLVIAVIASLAGVILFALNPAQRLEDASDTKALSSSTDIEKAIKVYSIDNGGALPTALQAITTSGVYDICKSGQTIGCINLDELVTGGKLSSIPEDSRYSSTHTSGYKIDFNTTKAEAKIYSKDSYDLVTKYCPPGITCTGPIAEWLFEEGSGTTANDTSGNNSNGTLTNGPTWTSGKYNSAIQFDGSDDRVTASSVKSIAGSAVSSSAWFYPTNNVDNSQMLVKYGIIGTPNALEIDWSDGGGNGLSCYIGTGSWTAAILTTSSNDGVALNTWHHIACIWDGSTIFMYLDGNLVRTASKSGSIGSGTFTFTVGNDLSGGIYDFYGKVDNIKIFNYARTPEQVAWEYNQGGPIAYYKFDECTGTTATNSAIDGNGILLGNNGTITIGATGTNTSLGTCSGSAGQAWNDGAVGKYNASLEFDGTDDYASITHNANQINLPLTITAWVKSIVINQGEWRAIVSKYSGGSLNGWNIDTSSGVYYFYYYANSSNYIINTFNGVSFGAATTNWSHLAVAVDSTSARLYRDGVLVNTRTWTGTAANATQTASLEIGRITGNSSFSFNGQVDDVRIYNYALNSSQVMQAMHER